MSVAASAAYYDFQGLSSLRTQAISAPKEALNEVAGQFESLFVQMMLKSMRDATIEGGLFDSNQMEVYTSMLDQQLSLHLSTQSSLGLADVLVEQLEGGVGTSERAGEESAAAPQGLLMALARGQRGDPSPAFPLSPVSSVSRVTPVTQPQVTEKSGPVLPPAAAAADKQDWIPASPAEFVNDVWDHAVEAAQELGLDPMVLVAQSALETGWGKRVIKTSGGDSSFNLFGIKSGASWGGEKATVNTVEFRDGIAAQEKASFRVYESLAGSFGDYVDFLKSNPRYQQALEKVSDSGEFLQGLQDAGYATDPAYAQKIMKIMGTATFAAAVQTLKNF